MLTHEQTKTAYELLAQAGAAFTAGDWPLGSTKLWDAFADAVFIIAQARGLTYNDDSDIPLVLEQLANTEQENYSMMLRLSTAQRFRDAPARGGPEDYEVECLAPEVPRIIDELIALA